MSITEVAFEVLKPYLKGDVFSLGYPDIAISKEILKTKYGLDFKRTHPDKEAAKAQHGLDDLPDTQEFFSVLGVKSFKCCDVKDLRGCEIVADLNEPQDFGQYDLVIDPGTLEHCFNIGQAALNAANAVKPGGYIFHGNPLSMINHGFYMLSPTWYWDWYVDNGWFVQAMLVTNHKVVEITPRRTSRFQANPDLSNLVLAQRKTDAPMKWPTQSKYKDMLA